ncbi:MAG TPA: hypothetical protein DCP28_10210 [Cytophagales bacterium]|nr:hypothetical protein [Cytophagales bacterium]
MPWMRGFLLLATGYNLLWGIFISQFPDSFYLWARGKDQEAPILITYQGYGVLIMAVVFLLAALNPQKYWYLPGFGALVKLGGAAGFWLLIMEFETTKKFLFHLIFNDLVWIPFLIAIMVRAYQVQKGTKGEKAS